MDHRAQIPVTILTAPAMGLLAVNHSQLTYCVLRWYMTRPDLFFGWSGRIRGRIGQRHQALNELMSCETAGPWRRAASRAAMWWQISLILLGLSLFISAQVAWVPGLAG